MTGVVAAHSGHSVQEAVPVKKPEGAEINVVASGVNTVEWLAEAVTTIAVPVYQRHYRWDVDRCSQLLEDVRAIADADDRETHFIGSILATADTATGLTLIDGQQ